MILRKKMNADSLRRINLPGNFDFLISPTSRCIGIQPHVNVYFISPAPVHFVFYNKQLPVEITPRK